MCDSLIEEEIATVIANGIKEILTIFKYCTDISIATGLEINSSVKLLPKIKITIVANVEIAIEEYNLKAKDFFKFFTSFIKIISLRL